MVWKWRGISSAESMILQAEDLLKDEAPSWDVFKEALWRFWIGSETNSTVISASQYGVRIVEHPRKDTVLFKEKDFWPWIVFTVVFCLLVIFDNLILHRKAKKLSLLESVLYTTFWIAVAAMFGTYVFFTRGLDDAFTWGTGYVLEWMLSVDNLFVFHRIFAIFKTPDEQKHKPLFYGIIGAIFFRMVFFVVEEILLHHVTWMHLVFGAFLIYTGIQALRLDDDDSPDQHWFFQYLVKHISYVDRYDENGNFFTTPQPGDAIRSYGESTSPRECCGHGENRCLATRLVLVVLCLEVTDLIFAVDSVSAIVAQIPDLFLAYTACVFAMLGLRAMFFAIDELVKMFALLAYGVAFILVFLGIKLMLGSWFHLAPRTVCVILVTTLLISIMASVVAERLHGTDGSDDEKEEEQRAGLPNAEEPAAAAALA